VAEAAVVGINDELTGQAVNAFVALKDGTESSDQVKKDLITQVDWTVCRTKGDFCGPRSPQDALRQDHAPYHAEDLGGRRGPVGRYHNGKQTRHFWLGDDGAYAYCELG
jgi:hypothetical protein